MADHGVGMPAALWLEKFGELVEDAFGEMPYCVGSSTFKTDWRDVDVRVMLDDDRYAAAGYGDPTMPHSNAKWVAMCLAFSALGKQMTGLPIDFQIQQATLANGQHGARTARSALGMQRRIAKFQEYALVTTKCN